MKITCTQTEKEWLKEIFFETPLCPFLESDDRPMCLAAEFQKLQCHECIEKLIKWEITDDMGVAE